MTEINYPAYYGILTANVRYNDQLSMSEKVMFSEITALSNAHGFCSARNKYFAKLYSKSEKTISIWIKHLKDYGFIQIEYKRRGAEIISRKIYPTSEHQLQKGNLTDNENVNRTDYKKVKDNNTSINNTSINIVSYSKQASELKKILRFYENNIGMISPFIHEELEQELNDWQKISQEATDLIILALKTAVEAQASNKVRFAFGVLNNWREKNISTLAQVKAEKLEHKRKKNYRNRIPNPHDPDYQNKKWDYIDPELGW